MKCTSNNSTLTTCTYSCTSTYDIYNGNCLKCFDQDKQRDHIRTAWKTLDLQEQCLHVYNDMRNFYNPGLPQLVIDESLIKPANYTARFQTVNKFVTSYNACVGEPSSISGQISWFNRYNQPNCIDTYHKTMYNILNPYSQYDKNKLSLIYTIIFNSTKILSLGCGAYNTSLVCNFGSHLNNNADTLSYSYNHPYICKYNASLELDTQSYEFYE